MKKIILIFMYGIVNLFAQPNNAVSCHSIDALTHDIIQSRNIDTAPYDDTTPYVLNMFFTFVNNSSGIPAWQGIINTPTQRENASLNCIRLLNIAYNSSGIYFKYMGNKIVINDFLTDGEPTFNNPIGDGWDALAPYKEEGTMNLYVLNRPGSSFDALPASIIGGTESVFSIDYLAYQPFIEFFLIHHIGHNLSLYNTYETGNHYDASSDVFNACEHVTRNVNDLLFNADLAGDEVVDTAAQPQTGSSYFLPNCGDYIFDPNRQNCEGEPYQNIQIGNYMGLNQWVGCWHITSGQTARMRKHIQYNTGLYDNNSDPTVRNDVSSLYQPFIITGGGNNSTDQVYSKTITPNVLDTGIDVWNCGPFTMRFQPGFDCEFSNLPNTVAQTVNNQFNAVCNGYYIGVKIPIIGPNTQLAMAPLCFGSFEPYTHGDIKSTSNLGSPNYTTEQLDEIKASDPELFEKLQAQKYHIITKETDSGYIDQKVIYKN